MDSLQLSIRPPSSIQLRVPVSTPHYTQQPESGVIITWQPRCCEAWCQHEAVTTIIFQGQPPPHWRLFRGLITAICNGGLLTCIKWQNECFFALCLSCASFHLKMQELKTLLMQPPSVMLPPIPTFFCNVGGFLISVPRSGW